MFSPKNVKLHDEIRRWNTLQLIDALESNGLGECCDAIRSREIDGDAFLNLSEGQLMFWKNSLSISQIKRLWSYIQLAIEKPQIFASNVSKNKFMTSESSSDKKIEKVRSPIAVSLEKVLGQQNNSSIISPSTRPEGNYPKITLNNDFLHRIPPKPGTLPPKPTSSGGKRLPPLPGDSFEASFSTEETKFRPPRAPLHDIKLPKPAVENNIFRPPRPAPPSYLSRSESPHSPERYNEDEEAVYEEEPDITSKNEPEALSPIASTLHKKPPNYENSFPEYLVPPSNPRPVKKEVPSPSVTNRPLPALPTDETPLRLLPNSVSVGNLRSPTPKDLQKSPTPLRLSPNLRSPAPSRDLPKPPASLLPPNILDFHEEDDEQFEYDFVEEIQDYRSQPWFLDIPRRQATSLLKDLPNGTFIARPSTKEEYECTFSVIYDGKIYNLPVEKNNGKVVLGKYNFSSVKEIVERFVREPLVLNGPNNKDVLVVLRKFGTKY